MESEKKTSEMGRWASQRVRLDGEECPVPRGSTGLVRIRVYDNGEVVVEPLNAETYNTVFVNGVIDVTTDGLGCALGVADGAGRVLWQA